MNKDIDVSSLKIDLYSDRSVRDFTADVAQKDGRMWLSNVSAEIAAEAVLIELLVCLDIPETASVGRYFVGKDYCAVGKSAELSS